MIDQRGKKVKGQLKSYDEKSVKRELQRRKIQVIKVTENNSVLSRLDNMYLGSSIRPRELDYYLNQLEALLVSEVNLVDACEMLAEQSESKRMKPILMDIYYKVSLGHKLSNVLKGYPKEFPLLLQNMISIGEKTGNLAMVISESRKRLTKQDELKKGILSAITTPLVYYVLAFVVVIYMSVSVFPAFGETFEGINNFEMPLLTKIFIDFGVFITRNWFFLVAGITAFIITFILLITKSPKFRTKMDALILKIPLLRSFIKLREQALLAGTLSILVNAKVDFIEALSVTKETVGNKIYKDLLEAIIVHVSNGGKISEILVKDKYIDQLFTRMVKVGEKTSDLPKMLNTIAAFYDKDSTARIGILKKTLEPVMMGVVYGVIILLFLALMLPSFSVSF